MNIAVIGSGYVGLPTACGLASFGHKVICIDNNPEKLSALKSGKLPLYEEGLQELYASIKDNLVFSGDISDIKNSELIILAVGTPMSEDASADLQYIYQAANDIKDHLQKDAIVATKSTVPVGTNDEIERTINRSDVTVVSMPEFLREGYALYDFFHPDRIIIGTDNTEVYNKLRNVYIPHIPAEKIIRTNRRSAELIKYASNAFLATKIQFINEISDLCEQLDANVCDVATGMGMDSRIGKRFLNAGIGYGGSCFPKDTKALEHMAKQTGVSLGLVTSTIAGNHNRRFQIASRINGYISEIKGDSKVAVLGLAFKNGTDDIRYSPAIDIIKNINHSCIYAYDPQAMENARKVLDTKVKLANSISDCVKDADIIVILTEWPEFKELESAEFIKRTLILDYRNILDADRMRQKNNVTYKRIGER